MQRPPRSQPGRNPDRAAHLGADRRRRAVRRAGPDRRRRLVAIPRPTWRVVLIGAGGSPRGPRHSQPSRGRGALEEFGALSAPGASLRRQAPLGRTRRSQNTGWRSGFSWRRLGAFPPTGSVRLPEVAGASTADRRKQHVTACVPTLREVGDATSESPRADVSRPGGDLERRSKRAHPHPQKSHALHVESGLGGAGHDARSLGFAARIRRRLRACGIAGSQASPSDGARGLSRHHPRTRRAAIVRARIGEAEAGWPACSGSLTTSRSRMAFRKSRRTAPPTRRRHRSLAEALGSMSFAAAWEQWLGRRGSSRLSPRRWASRGQPPPMTAVDTGPCVLITLLACRRDRRGYGLRRRR